MKKYKILISCYACSPYRGSEPGMGWNFVKEISRFHEVHVIVEKEKWEQDINKFLNDNLEYKENINFYFIQKNRNRKLRKIWPPSYYYYYRQWQKKAFNVALELNDKHSFDFSHQLNMVGFREPGYLWKLDIPFVWGPIGGLKNTPWNFFSEFDFYGKLYYGGRNLLNSLQIAYLNRPRKAVKRANSLIIAATPGIKDLIMAKWGRSSDVICEIGSHIKKEQGINIREPKEPLKIVWSGQHTPGKALNILLKALHKLPSEVKWKLDILGTGEMTGKWKLLSEKLGINSNCKWHDWLPKDDAMMVMDHGHLFCITSLKDLTSSVTLEALETGMPIICLDHCGFSYVVNTSCGIKIPLTSPKEVISEFAKHITKIYLDENLRQTLSKNAILRSRDFLWREKTLRLIKLYDTFLENSNQNN